MKPNAWQRLKMAWGFYRHGIDRIYRRAVATQQAKSAPYLWPDWRDGEPVWKMVDFESYAQEGFNENAIIYNSIMYKARAITSTPLVAYGGGTDTPEKLPADDPLTQLVTRPNKYMSFSEFQALNEVYFNLAGNAYILVDRQRGQDVPIALYPLRPDRVRVIPIKSGSRKYVGYAYAPEGMSYHDAMPILAEDMMHIKLPNPLDPLEGLGEGLSALSASARSANVDNEITRYLKLFFEKGAVISGLLKYDVPLDDVTAARARERWMEIYGGTDNMWKIAVLDQGGSYERVALTFDEMGFESLDERNESRITGAFGVPPILIGARVGLNRATYSNYEQAHRAFWLDTMIPELKMFQSEYQYYLQGGAGEFVRFDLGNIPALKPSYEVKAQSLNDAFVSGAVTRNEYRAALGLDSVEGGDVFVLPVDAIAQAQLAEADQTEAGAVEAVDDASREERTAPPAPEKKERGSSLTDEQKQEAWKQFDRQAADWEERYSERAAMAFERDRREILAILNGEKSAALARKATPDWGGIILKTVDYLRNDASLSWGEIFRPVLEGLIIERGEELNVQFGFTFDVRNLLAEEWFNQYVITFAQPINDTTESAIRQVLQQGMEEGWSIPEAQNNLTMLFEQWMTGNLTRDDFQWYADRLPPHRTEMIARTETIAASNVGSLRLYNAWGAPAKEWLATADMRTRDTHASANGQIVPINEPFIVGGYEMQYPGDKNAPVGEVVNCRCTVLPVLEDEQ